MNKEQLNKIIGTYNFYLKDEKEILKKFEDQQVYNIVTDVTDKLKAFGVYNNFSHPFITLNKNIITITMIQRKNNTYTGVQPILNNLKNIYSEGINITAENTLKDIANIYITFKKEKIEFKIIDQRLNDI